MQEKLNLDVCLTPGLIGNYDFNNTVVVIIDIVRASTTICTAIHYNVEHVLPVEKIEDALLLKNQGYIIAGERNGDKLEGFDYGNSPISLMDRKIEGKKLAITTTNGTRTIQEVLKHSQNSEGVEILIGSWVNYTKVFNYLNRCNKNILLVCSGWKNNPSIEDTLYAGQLATKLELSNKFNFRTDSAIHASIVYQSAGNNTFDFIIDHSTRFVHKIAQLGTDIRYCLKLDAAPVLPFLKEGKFVNHTD